MTFDGLSGQTSSFRKSSKANIFRFVLLQNRVVDAGERKFACVSFENYGQFREIAGFLHAVHLPAAARLFHGLGAYGPRIHFVSDQLSRQLRFSWQRRLNRLAGGATAPFAVRSAQLGLPPETPRRFIYQFSMGFNASGTAASAQVV